MNHVRTSAIAILGAAALGLGACATTGPAPSSVAVFDVAAFAWSNVTGANTLQGQVAYSGGGQRWSCEGSIGLTPETPWTRQRFQTLYGSTERASVPAAVVRARSVAEASADYRAFVRNTTCDDMGRFAFSNLPDGAWFLIVQVGAPDAETVVLMRRVETRGGRVTAVTLD